MRKREKIALIEKVLNDLFPNPPIPLYHKNNYTLLIAVLLSAQSTDAGVNRVTPLLFEKADSAEKMLLLTIAEIQTLIRTCGLSPRKAKAIFELSKIIVEKHQGLVPDNFHDLEALPGVGHKTASVVLAQGFGKHTFPVDTHIFRCAHRWGLSRGKRVEQVEKDLKKIFPERTWNKLHLQIIYYARKHCPARGHKKEKCLICSLVAPL